MDAVNLADRFAKFTDHWSPKIVARLNCCSSTTPWRADTSAPDRRHQRRRPEALVSALHGVVLEQQFRRVAQGLGTGCGTGQPVCRS